jgi:hypothetical protein
LALPALLQRVVGRGRLNQFWQRPAKKVKVAPRSTAWSVGPYEPIEGIARVICSLSDAAHARGIAAPHGQKLPFIPSNNNVNIKIVYINSLAVTK